MTPNGSTKRPLGFGSCCGWHIFKTSERKCALIRRCQMQGQRLNWDAHAKTLLYQARSNLRHSVWCH